MSFPKVPRSEGSALHPLSAPGPLTGWGAGDWKLGVWIQPLRGQLSQDAGQMGCSSISSSLRAFSRISNLCPHWDSHPPAEYPNQLCCAVGASCRPVPEAGVPNELINVGKALGDLRLKGVQYTQIRVGLLLPISWSFCWRNYSERTVAGPVQSSCQDLLLNSSGICLPFPASSLPPSLLLSCVLPQLRLAACSSTANAFFVSSPHEERHLAPLEEEGTQQ